MTRHRCTEPRGTPRIELTDELVLAGMIRMVEDACAVADRANATLLDALTMNRELQTLVNELTERLRDDTAMRQIIEKLCSKHPSARTIQ